MVLCMGTSASSDSTVPRRGALYLARYGPSDPQANKTTALGISNKHNTGSMKAMPPRNVKHQLCAWLCTTFTCTPPPSSWFPLESEA